MPPDSQPAVDVDVCRVTWRTVSHQGCFLWGHKENIRNVSKLTLFLKRWLLYTCFLKYSQQSQSSSIRPTVPSHWPALAKTKLSFMFHLIAMCNFKKTCQKTSVWHAFSRIVPWNCTNGAVEVAQTPSDFLEISQGRGFSYVQLKEMRLMEPWKERRIETKTSLTTLHFGDSVWKPPAMGRQSGKKRRFGLSASYPATPKTHPKCPQLLLFLRSFSLSHLFLIKNCLP